MLEYVLRFLIGGAIVSVFAMAGDLFQPRSFAGLFGAAPSVALATLLLTVSKEGAGYASLECRSMLAGAAALGIYAWVVCRLLIRRRMDAFPATLYAMPAWFAAAFGLWFAFLR